MITIKSTSFLKDITIHESWKPFFEKEDVIDLLKSIELQVGSNYTPSTKKVLRFAEVDLEKVRVIVNGKDPYPQVRDNGELVATGRAFEVNGVQFWFDKGVNSSLKNMIKAIHKIYNGLDEGSPIAAVRSDIESGKFPILPPNKAFEHWEKEGVLFLNTAFTCEIGGFEQAGSHLKIWNPFFHMLLEYITTSNSEIKYFLWGDARKYEKVLKKLKVLDCNLYLSKHPCTNGDKGGFERNTNFLNNPCFKDTKAVIKWV